jgi:hypothetical protein
MSKMRIAVHHRLFSAQSYEGPRQCIGLDIKRVKTPTAVAFLLLCVDAFSGFITVSVMQNRRTSSVISAMREDFFRLYGPPRKVTVDGAGELESRELKSWLALHGAVLRHALPYYSMASGVTEYRWNFINEAMRRVNDFSSMESWVNTLQDAVQGHNRTARASKPSPFELFFGTPPNTAAVNMAVMRLNETVILPEGDTLAQAVTAATKATRLQVKSADDLRRRITQIELNKRGRKVSSLYVGQAVWYYMKISGGAVRRTDKQRPRFAQRRWRKGVVVAKNSVRITIKPTIGRRLQIRHRSMVVPRTPAYEERTNAS